jgi:hypothetical protein
MSCRLFLLVAGTFAVGCAPAIPPRPELPPVSAGISTTEAGQRSAPVIPKPDLTSVTSEVRAAANLAGETTRATAPGRR